MTNYTTLDSKDSETIRNKFVNFLNDNLIDPYEQRTGKSRDSFVYGGDFKLVAIFPKIHFDIMEYNSKKVTASKSNYLEEETHSFIVYYYNQNAHKFAFDDGSVLSDSSQNMRYLQYVKKMIKDNLSDFDEYCHNITFGTIPKAVFNRNSACWVGMLPITVFTYNR